jgi:hypothetical protein
VIHVQNFCFVYELNKNNNNYRLIAYKNSISCDCIMQSYNYITCISTYKDPCIESNEIDEIIYSEGSKRRHVQFVKSKC